MTAVPTTDAEHVAVLLQRLEAAGWGGDDLLFKIEETLPGLTFRHFCAGLALHRARSWAATHARFIHAAAGHA